MRLKNIILGTMLALVLAPVVAFAKGPHFSLSLNMMTPPRPCIVRPCCPPPCPVMYYPSPYYVYPYVPYVVYPGGWSQGFSVSVGR